MNFARDNNDRTILHLLSATWEPENDAPALGVLCRSSNWKVSDAPAGRDDLFCGRCMNVWQSLVDDLPEPDDAADAKSYAVYLQGRHWQHMRGVALEHYGEQCLLCGTTDELDVHHRTYERRGRERLADLTVLCRGCHSRYHHEAA